MPAKDIYHDTVKTALIKDGWTITADPYKIKFEDAELYADLAAEKPIAAERNDQKIIVEIKSFINPSPMRDFENALGQYILYRNLLNLSESEYKIYLAVRDSVFDSLFQRKSIQSVVNLNQISLVVFNKEKEEITEWID
ncbi:MAG: XisH family protein [Spirulina sp.]